MSEIKEDKQRINKLGSVFQKSMTYPNSFIWRQVVDFNSTQWNEIEPSIKQTLDYLDTYRFNNKFQDYGNYRDKIEIYAVSCLPFLLFKGTIKNPDIEDRKFRQVSLDWLKYIKQNKIYAGLLIHQMTTDDSITNIQDDLLDKQIAVAQWFVDTAKKTTKKKNWSNVLQFLYLADTIDKLWNSSELNKKQDFLMNFFGLFDVDIEPDVIYKSMIEKARECPLINVSKEHIQKVLSQPNNKLTEEDIREYFHNDLSKSLI